MRNATLITRGVLLFLSWRHSISEEMNRYVQTNIMGYFLVPAFSLAASRFSFTARSASFLPAISFYYFDHISDLHARSLSDQSRDSVWKFSS